MLHEVGSGNQCLTGRVFKNQILLLRKRNSPAVTFCSYIILAVFHFDYFWVNFGRKSKVLILI